MPDPVAAHLAWLRMRRLSPHTIYDRSRVLHRLRAALPVPLLDATEDHLAAWRESLNHLSGHAIATYCGHVQQFYRFAVREGMIAASPAEGLPIPGRRRGLPRPIAEDDLMAALASAPPRVRPWLVLAAWCGLRAREIAYLRREDICDRNSPPVLVVTEAAAKGGRPRVVPLSAFVLAELQAARLPLAGWAFRRADGAPGFVGEAHRRWTIGLRFYYASASVEAIGRATRELVASLESSQHRDGSWRNTESLVKEDDPLIATAFAVRALSATP